MQRDPDLWLRVLSWLVIAFSIIQVLLFSFGQEHGAIATVASGLLSGKTPYLQLWDAHPPGIYFTYATAFALFGQNMAAPRLLEALCLVGVALSCRRLGGVFFASRTAGLMGGASSTLILAQHEFQHTALPASYAGALTLISLVIVTHPWPRHRAPWAWLVAGLLAGCIALLRPVLIAGLLPACAFLFVHRRRDGYPRKAQLLAPGLVLVGSLIPISMALTWFATRGALEALNFTLTRYTWLSARSVWTEAGAPHLLYDALLKALFQQSALLAAGLIAAAALRPRARREKEGFLLLFSVACLQLAGIAFRATFLPEQFLASLPPLSLIAGVGLYKLWRRIGPGSIAGTLAFCALLIVLPPMRGPDRDLPESFWQRSQLRLTYLLGAGRLLTREELDRRLERTDGFQIPGLRRVAGELVRLTAASDTIWVDGDEPLLYWLAQREPASRYVRDPAAAVPEVAGLTGPIRERELLRNPPTALVLPPTGDDASDAPPTGLQTITYFGSSYVQKSSVEGHLIYVLQSATKE